MIKYLQQQFNQFNTPNTIMSDIDSSQQKQHQSHNKLAIEVPQQESNNQNMFNFRERSRHNSSDHQNSFEEHDSIIKESAEDKNQAKDQVKQQKQSSQKIDSKKIQAVKQDKTKNQVTQSNDKPQKKQQQTTNNDKDNIQEIKVIQKEVQENQQKTAGNSDKSQNTHKQQEQQKSNKDYNNIKSQPNANADQTKSLQKNLKIQEQNISKVVQPIKKQTVELNFTVNNQKRVQSTQNRSTSQPQKKVQDSQKQAKAQQKDPKSPKQRFELAPQPKLATKHEDVLKPQTKQQGQETKNEANEVYEKQIQDDLANLKKNLVKKKKANPVTSNQVNDKKKLNQTVMVKTNSNELQFDETPQTRAMEVKMISTMALQKKKQNYNLLRQWDKRRADSLAIHRNMIQILQNQIDKRIKSSIQNLQIYTTFLRQKAKQQQKYLSHPVINTKYALQNNSISKNVYINCTVILNTLSQENNLRCKKIADFLQIVRNDILRDTIQAHLLQSQKQLLKVREKISALKAALRKSNSETEQKTNELALFFNQNSVKMNFESQKDFFLTQLQFLSKAFQQTIIQKKLGENCFEYLQTAIDQQIKRSKVIRDCMITFIKAMEQCFNIQTDPAEIQQLSKAEQNKLIKEFYSLQQIFDERCVTVFKNHENIDETKQMTNQLFLNFLKKLQFQGFDCRMLLLKQYNVKYIASSKSETVNQSQSCYLVITVDKWIHLFLSKEKTDQYARPDISIKATLKNLQLKPTKSQGLEIVLKDERKPSMISYFWESKSNQRVYKIEFAKKDNREEFMDFIRKIRG